MALQNLLHRVDEISEFLSILGNGKRLAIMLHLMDGELSVSAIARRVNLSQSALSQHLARLRAMNLVTTRRDRQTIYYSCSNAGVRLLLQALENIPFPPSSRQRLDAVAR